MKLISLIEATMMFSFFCLCFLTVKGDGLFDVIPDLEPFDWEAGGSFFANGTTTTKQMYIQIPNFPAGGLPAVSSPGSIALDTVNQRYSIHINANNSQYGFSNGTYYFLNGVCSFVPETYLDFVRVYKSALQIGTGPAGLIRTYTGLVREPGACQMYASITMVRAQVGPWTKLLSMSFSQVLNFATLFGQQPQVLIPGHGFGHIHLTNWDLGVPDASHFQLPATCYINNYANVKDYCTQFYSTPFFNTPI